MPILVAMVRIRVLPLALTALALLLSGCGDSSDGSSAPGAVKIAPGAGEDTPQAAVTEFLRVAGHAGADYTKLEAACGRVAPSVRAALRAGESVTPSDTYCAAALSLMMFYAGDTGAFETPTGMSGEVTGVSEHGDRAVVEVAINYEGASNPGADSTRVLTVRERDAWWIATPMAFNVSSASRPPTDVDLEVQYRQLADAAAKAERLAQSGRNATTNVNDDLRRCPADGASSAPDASGDVRVADGMTPAEQQPGAHDLIRVTFNTDGSGACFELRFAADAPEEGEVEFDLRPDGGIFEVQWADGEAVGTRGYDDPVAVKVAVARAGSTMTFRLPADSLGGGSGPYRWAVSLHTPTEKQRVAHFDSVPDDLSITGDDDAYIHHGD